MALKHTKTNKQRYRWWLDKLGDDDSLPSWWTNKVAVAVERLDSMADYLDVKVEDK